MKLLIVLLATVAACSGAPQLFHPVTYTGGAVVVHANSHTPAVTRIQEPGIRLSVPKPVQYFAQVPVATPIHLAAPVPFATQVQVVAGVPVSAPVAVTAYKATAPVVPAAPVVVAVPPEPLLAPAPPMPSLNVPFVGGQFHVQDEAKQYSFGHWGGPNTRVETRDYLGRVSGSFAYVNPDGDVHVRKYAAAPAMGFKVAASDLPKDTPAVAQIKASHALAQKEVREFIANSAV